MMQGRGMEADTAVEGAVMAPPRGRLSHLPGFLDSVAELLDLFLVGKLGGNRLAPAAPPGNNDLSLARGRAVVYVVHGKDFMPLRRGVFLLSRIVV